MNATVIVVMSLLFACGRAVETAEVGTAPELRAARQIIAYVVAPDPNAASLLADSFRGSSPARETLARHYRSHGFGTMARLFGAHEHGAALNSWGCPDAGDATIDREARDVADLRNAGHNDLAARNALASLERHPGSCQLQVEWAKAVLLQDLQTKSTDTVVLEQAIRTLVTGAAEVVVVPDDSIGPAQTLHDVSRVFRARGDFIDALRCLDLAQQSLDEEVKQAPPLLKVALQKLQTRIAQDAAALRAHVR
jgi:hypothetical protein